MKNFLTAPQFARLVGVSKNTISNWEKQGFIEPHHITPTGRRYYSLEQVDNILSRKRSENLEEVEGEK